ncbi:MAG: Calx-beta domain-containing protein, partial [Planctomycetota bacterium]
MTEHTYTIRDPRPVVGFEADSSVDREDAGWVSIPVSLSFAAIHTVTVDYYVLGGTAAGGGVDYTLEPGTLTFSPGQTSKWINIAVTDDGVNEADETVMIMLSNAAGGKMGNGLHILTLVDPTFLDLKVDLGLEDPLESG